MLFNSNRLAALWSTRGMLSNPNLVAGFANSSSSSLARLRKLTGHPFGFCREALAACNGDYDVAVKWLEDESVKRGVAKADKLKNRMMSQGLIGLISTPKCVAACEVNCETDFVARNKDFQSLLASATESVHAHVSNTSENGTYWMNQISIGNLPLASPSGGSNSLSELLSSMIGSVGENMAITRAVGMNLTGTGGYSQDSRLAAYCHMSSVGVQRGVRGVQFGKYVSIIHYRPSSEKSTTSKEWDERASKVANQICQHIVGMNPQPGLLELSAIPAVNPDDERCLLRQTFLLDESLDVNSLLRRHDIQLEDFVRLECGIEEEVDTSLPN